MIVRVTTEIDLDTGDYDVKFENVSRPGEEIDYTKARRALERVVTGVDDSLGEAAQEVLQRAGA